MSERAFDPELVRQKMKERKVSQTALADLVGLPSQSAMSNILKGRRQVKAHEAKIINDFLGIAPQPEVMRIPIIGITAAGKWREAVQMPMGFLPVAPRSAGDRCFALEVSGDSMDKLVPDGGWVVIDPDRKELRPGSIYLLLDGWEQATVKMYLRHPSRFEPCSTNENHKPFLVSDEDFTVVGKVILMISPAP